MRLALLCCTASVLALASAGGARAAEAEDLKGAVAALQARAADQESRLEAQNRRLQAQEKELERLRALVGSGLDDLRGRGAPPSAAAEPQTVSAAAPQETQPAPAAATPEPVGQPPPEQPPPALASAPEGYGVLTPPGRWVVEPSIDFTHGSSNRLVFRGVEIVTGIQIGVIEASDADRNAWTGVLSLRTGVTRRLEAEVRLPYMYRDDRVTTLAQRDETVSRTLSLEGQGIGDVEAALRYQITRGRGGMPILIGGVRVKSDTGTSPFEVDRDQFGVASELATGSGFWAVEGSLNVLYPSDPIVIFGGISYLDHMLKHIDRDIGGVRVGKVDPGDSIGANIGFGFSVNPRFSFSLGYKHNYIYPTISILNGTRQKSTNLQVGALTFGWSLALTDRITLNNAFEIGATSDAPDIRVVLRLPIRF